MKAVPAAHRPLVGRRGLAALAIPWLLALGSASAQPQPNAPASEEPTGFEIEVEVSARLDSPFERVRAVLVELERFGEWFPATAEWRVLAGSAPGPVRIYGRQDLPWPVRDRDYVADYSWADEEGSFVLLAVALASTQPAPPPDVVRIERMRTEWRVEAEGSGSRVRYRYRGDPGGRLPSWVAQVGWQSQVGLLIDGLSAQLERRAQESETVRRAP